MELTRYKHRRQEGAKVALCKLVTRGTMRSIGPSTAPAATAASDERWPFQENQAISNKRTLPLLAQVPGASHPYHDNDEKAANFKLFQTRRWHPNKCTFIKFICLIVCCYCCHHLSCTRAAPEEVERQKGGSIQLNSDGHDPISSSTQQQDNEDNSLLLAIITANIVIFVIGFCGNSLVILVILKFTRIETVTDIYILNLAFADLMFLLGLVFLTTTMLIDHWIFGNLMCKLYMATTSLNQFASSLLLVVMSFDRFLAVCHPIYAQRFRRIRRAKTICLCIWVTCLILMTPIFMFAKTDPSTVTCAIFWPEYESFNCEMAFTVYSFAIGFAFPLMLIAIFYACVVRTLRKAVTGPASSSSSRRSRARETTNRRIEHLVIGIICTYTICWLPYWVAQLCVSLDVIAKLPGFYHFFMVGTALTYTNSALNPILYAFLSDNFKRRCSEVFTSLFNFGLWCRKQSRVCFNNKGSQMHTVANNSSLVRDGPSLANKFACPSSMSTAPTRAQTEIDLQHISCLRHSEGRQAATTVILDDREQKIMFDLDSI